MTTHLWTPRLVALDIDGTLIDFEEQMTAAVRAAVREVVAADVPVVLSTGRSVHGIVPIIEELGLPPGLGVASNGAVVFEYPPPDIVHAETFDAATAVRAVLERLPEALVAVEVVGQGYRVNRVFPADEIGGEIWVQSVDELVAEPVTRVIIRDPARSSEEFVELADSLGLHGTSYFVGWTAWLDLAPEGITKAFGLALVADRLGVDAADVLAIGDGRNDVDMLGWAGRGVAMGQSPQVVKDAADDVTGTIADDGTSEELHRWFGERS